MTFEKEKLFGMPKNLAIALSWLFFPLGIVLLCVYQGNKELKYRDKAQLLSAIINEVALILVVVIFNLLGNVIKGFDALIIFPIFPLIAILVISIIKALKCDYFNCPILNKIVFKILKNENLEEEDEEYKVKDMNLSGGTKSIISSIVSILIGIFCGFIVMIVIGALSKDSSVANAFKGLKILISGCFASTKKAYLLTNTGDVIFYAVPLIFTGLSVAIAYKTGLFNIGAPGQYVMGTMGSLLVALSIKSTTRAGGIAVWALAIVVGMLFGAIWGAIPGLLKAFFNINEVIISIMTNWIAANICTWVFSNCTNLISKENTKGAYLITTKETLAYTPKFGFDNLFPGSYIDAGIIFAIIIAILIFILLNKTTLGYQLKACGFNKNASKYAGLNDKKNIVLSMVIAGGLAGLGACFYYLNPGIEFKYASQYAGLPSYGFNGIASAFLANCNPVGTVFSSLLIRYLNMGGEYLTKVGFNRYVADIIIAIVIYVAGFSRIINEFLSKSKKRDNSKRDGSVIEKPKVEEEKSQGEIIQEEVTDPNVTPELIEEE